MVEFAKLSTRLLGAARAVWKGGSPFATITALWPTNDEGKYVIQAEGIRLAFTNHGAALSNLFINDTHGQEIDIVLGLDHADMYPETRSNPSLNGIIGRYAGYLSGASYNVDETRYHVWPNALDGTATYNGGPRGWGRRDWDVPTHTEDSITFVMFDRAVNGFPGLFVSCLTHTVSPYEWRIAYGVTPLLTPGPINMVQQVFFNLNGLKANATRTVLGHRLHLPSAGLRFGVDEQGIATGDLLSNKRDREHDFWSGPRNIGDAVNQPYDETFLLSYGRLGNKEQSPAAIMSSTQSGITMELTWKNENDPLRLKHNQGDCNVPDHGGISLEATDWPDGVNHPEWRGRKTAWSSKDIYTAFVTYKFKVEGGEAGV